nr:hypothetical protein [Flavobacterium sp.]
MLTDTPFLHADLEDCTPEMIDKIWADGWRNFGSHFFRNQLDYFEERQEWVKIIPLRIDLMKFSFRNHQKKLLRKQEAAIKTVFRSVVITPRIEELFYKHTSRFKHNVPENIN